MHDRIVIADDDAEMRGMLAMWLAGVGYRVDAVASGEELLALLEAGQVPHIVVSDIRMPGIDGLEALATICAAYPKVRVILITAYGDAQTHERARELGAAAVFDKPFDLVALGQAIHELLNA